MRCFLAFLCFIPLISFSQSTSELSGIVIGRNEPVPFANIKLMLTNGTFVQGGKSSVKGEFKLNVPYNEYKIEISALGYKKYESKIVVNTPSLTLGGLKLEENTAKISEILISGNKNTKASNIDKKEYTPTQLLSSQNASASELVNAIPSINMGNDAGNVSFRGDENVAVMINGKMSSLSGQNLSQIPASSIEKIEVISVPNSKYNSEGSAGIINIVMKKAIANYSGGYVLGSVGNNNKYNAQIGYNWNINKIAIAAAYNFIYNEFENSGWSNREYLLNTNYNSYRHISGGEKYKRLHSLRLGVDYEFDKQNTISVIGNISRDWGSAFQNDYDTFRTNTSAIYSLWNLDNTEKDINTLYDFNLSFQHWAANMKDKWTIEFSRSDNMNDKIANFNRNYSYYEGIHSAVQSQYAVENMQRRPITAIQTDYMYNVSSIHQLETGLRFSNRDFRFTNMYLENQTIVPKWTNDFNYVENISSLYGLWSSNWSSKWTTKMGLRMEQTNTESMNYDSSIYRYNYFKAFPSAMMRYQLSSKGFVSASYSMRINRPGAGMLNPLQDVSDPISKRLGNPKLEPEVINSYELAYGNDISSNISFSTSAYYKVSNNAITRFLSTNTDGTIQVIIDNIGKSTFSGWELIGNVKLSKALSLNLSSNLSYNTLDYTTPAQRYESSYINWQGRGIFNFKLPLGMDGQLIAFYKSPMNSPQGKIMFMSNVDLSIRKKLFHQNGLLILSVFDIFNDTKFQLANSDVDFINEFQRKRETRYVTLSFRYNIGKETLGKKPKIEKLEPKEGSGDGGGM